MKNFFLLLVVAWCFSARSTLLPQITAFQLTSTDAVIMVVPGIAAPPIVELQKFSTITAPQCFTLIGVRLTNGAALAFTDLVLSSSAFYRAAQTAKLSVTDFGAIGDAEQVWVGTVSNKVGIVFTNTLSVADIGKTIELFGVGAVTIPGNNQDLIGIITNVIGDVAFIAGDVPMVTATSVYCVYGTENVKPFAACLAAAALLGSNITISIPHGTVSPWGTTNAYLLIPPQQYTNYTYTYYPYGLDDAGILLNRGGLTFQGDGEGQTILMGDGAFKNEGYACMRGMVFACIGPVSNNYPLVWTNLTFDGGLPQGYVGDEGIQPANWVDGMGWDGTSAAGVDEGSEPLNIFKEFASCEFRHFRGEMIKGITGSAQNETILVTNCLFWDGNATAFNYNFAHTITGCVFSNMYQIEEFYLKYPTNAPSFFVNNYATNITHNFISLNGGTLTNEPYVISNNVFYCNMNGNGIATCPASSVTIVSNLFVQVENPQAFTIAISVGEAGAQAGAPDACNTNILIADNVFSNAFYGYLQGGGQSVSDVNRMEDVMITNNTLIGAPYTSLVAFSWCSNVTVSGNNCFGSEMGITADASGGPYAFVSTNNDYWQGLLENGQGPTGNTNAISYGRGSRYNLMYPNYSPPVMNYLTVADSNEIPAGATIIFTNTTQNYSPSGPVTVYLDGPNYSGPSVVVSPGTSASVNWNGSTWVQE